MSRSRNCLLFAGCLFLVVSSGCTKSGIMPKGWWQDWKDTAKAASGTGEYLGSSPEARDVERSLGSHRRQPVATFD